MAICCNSCNSKRYREKASFPGLVSDISHSDIIISEGTSVRIACQPHCKLYIDLLFHEGIPSSVEEAREKGEVGNVPSRLECFGETFRRKFQRQTCEILAFRETRSRLS